MNLTIGQPFDIATDIQLESLFFELHANFSETETSAGGTLIASLVDCCKMAH